MNYNNNNGKDDINIGVGCLPYFLFYIILVCIRFFLAKGESWESGFVEFLGFVYWIGIGYMIITIIINKGNEQSKLSRVEILKSSELNRKLKVEKKPEMPKVQSLEIKKVDVNNKNMPNDILYNKIGNAKWELTYLDESNKPPEEVEFCKDGRFLYRNLPCKWSGERDNIEILINNSFVKLNGKLIGDVFITGSAKNIKNLKWNFEIKLVKFYLNPINPIITEDLIGSKWKIQHSASVYEDAMCEFLENNVLKYRNKTDWTWTVNGDEIVLKPLTLFSTFTCKIVNGKLTGSAINKSGKKWTVSGEIIKNDLFNIRVKTKSTLSSTEPPPLSIEELQNEEELIRNNDLYLTESNQDFSTDILLNSNSNSSLEVINPKNDYNFSIESDNNNITLYKWYALWKYFPKNRFPDDKLNSIDLIHRLMVFEFKDGHNPEKYSKIISEALIQKFGKNLLKTKTLLIVPASNKSKTDKRFMLFCEKLSITTGLINGYHILTNNEKAKIPKRLGGENDILSFIKLNSSIKGKDFIIIDDIRTSGKSSNDVNQLLMENGAKSTIFIYFGRTVSSNTFLTKTIQIDNDDLPF